jgi:N-acetylglutamate synthase-like GNAT family acetyltransferase
MRYEIREATIDDAKQIAVLSSVMGYPSTQHEVEFRLHDILKTNNQRVFVAAHDTDVIGWIHSYVAKRIESNQFIEIGGLSIQESKRKLGVGTSLVEEVKKWAKDKNLLRVRVRCHDQRTEAHAFYASIGFNLTKSQGVFDFEL